VPPPRGWPVPSAQGPKPVGIPISRNNPVAGGILSSPAAARPSQRPLEALKVILGN
jgi:hypothetical protein